MEREERSESSSSKATSTAVFPLCADAILFAGTWRCRAAAALLALSTYICMYVLYMHTYIHTFLCILSESFFSISLSISCSAFYIFLSLKLYEFPLLGQNTAELFHIYWFNVDLLQLCAKKQNRGRLKRTYVCMYASWKSFWGYIFFAFFITLVHFVLEFKPI